MLALIVDIVFTTNVLFEILFAIGVILVFLIFKKVFKFDKGSMLE